MIKIGKDITLDVVIPFLSISEIIFLALKKTKRRKPRNVP